MKYYLNKNRQQNGDYEVHVQGCAYGALPENQIQLGEFANCAGAVTRAKQQYPDVANHINGCYFCCQPCHTS